MRSLYVWLFTLLAIWPGMSASAPLAPQDAPEPLRPWVKWVLQGHEQERCPFQYDDADVRHCSWPSRLDLRVADGGADFSQHWLVIEDDWLPLPGDIRHWPQDVRLDGLTIAVTERDGLPAVRVLPGLHLLTGKLTWGAAPEALTIPRRTGIVSLTLRDRPVDFPEMDAEGRLWLHAQAGRQEAGDSLDLKVYRRIIDDIPLVLVTRMEIEVSGKQRAVLLGPVLGTGYLPMSLESPLPARVEPDGRLRLQVRPGRWSLTLSARHQGPVAALALEPAAPPWPKDEVWVFDARHDLRLVTVEGGTALDPQQTTLPQDWRRLPAYRMRAGESLRLMEKRRGDPDPAPDQLALQRSFWLDFDGRGYTVQDHISGTMTRGWRLEMSPPIELGHVAVDGEDQFLTRAEGSPRTGVEVRRGSINLVADSRIDGASSYLPAVGWDRTFYQVSGTLNLPPGWRLLHATGADDVPDTWVTRWTLLDLFLVLVIALSVGKLWGWPWGLLALLTLALIYHEPGAPQWAWLNVLAAAALLRVLPPGRARRVITLYRNLSLAVLLIIALPFMVDQVRQALFPQLERPWQAVGESAGSYPAPAAPQAAVSDIAGLLGGKAADSLVSRKAEAPAQAPAKQAALYRYDPKAAVQTGPGLPQWQWNSIPLHWSGPVEPSQQVRLFLLPPPINLALGFIRVLLIAALIWLMSSLRYRRGHGWRFPPTGAAASAMLVMALIACPPTSARADFPPKEMLDDLRARLLEPPECLPQCAASPRLRLEIAGDVLSLRMEVHSQEHLAVPLPGEAGQWLPNTVLVDGEPARGLLREDIAASGKEPAGEPPRAQQSTRDAQPARGTGARFWLELPSGLHQITLEGPLPRRNTLQLTLPLKPRLVELAVQGWSIEGVHDDGLVDDQLQLTRKQQAGPGVPAALEAAVLPPLLRVERTLLLGLNWQVDTRVVRVTPPGSAALAEIPLLDGESVTSDGVRVQGGKVLLNMAPGATEARWRSAFDMREAIALRAPDTGAWTEVWRVDVSPIWHMQSQGIPVVHHQSSSGQWLPEWRPWPGESVALRLTRPQGVPGNTLTVDRSQWVITPGQRAVDAQLTLSLRSSRGAQHRLTLPDGAELQSVSIDGTVQPIRQDGRRVTLPLVPGAQSVQLQWRQPGGIAERFQVPAVDIGADSVNASVQIDMPRERWVLFAAGPRVGPAVLFWGVVIVILLVAVGLGRVRLTPLKTHHWALLGLGLAPVAVEVSLLVVAWLLALGLRRRLSPDTKPATFNLIQIGLALLTWAALYALFFAIQQGLLGTPEMQIMGNGSSAEMLRWYQDRAGPALPRPWVLSVPMLAYRVAMLAWALWLAFALLRWLRWGWDSFSQDGVWRKVRLIKAKRFSDQEAMQKAGEQPEGLASH